MAKRRALMVAALALVVVGAVDAALDGVWDLFTVFSALAVALGVLLLLDIAGHGRGRSAVTLRSDLYRAVRRRSRFDGESVDALVDRAIAFEVRLRERESWPTSDG